MYASIQPENQSEIQFGKKVSSLLFFGSVLSEDLNYTAGEES